MFVFPTPIIESETTKRTGMVLFKHLTHLEGKHSMDSLFTPTLISVALVSLLLDKLRRMKNSNHKIKGVKLAPKVSGALPLIGHLHLLAMAGQTPLAKRLAAFADKHGSIFTINLGAYPALVVSNREAAKECFTTNDRVLASRPKSSQGVHLGYNYAGFVFAPSSPYWRNIKKLVVLELLSTRRLESLKHSYDSEITSFIKDLYLYLGGEAPVPVVISEWLEHLSFNMITKIIAGKRYFGSFRDTDDQEARRIGKLIKDFTHISGEFVPSDRIPLLEWFNYEGKVLKSVKRIGREFDALGGSWVEEHIMKRQKNEGSDEKQDFIDVMLSLIEDDPTFGYTRDTIIKATAVTLIVAGADTTSITMTWMLSLLLNNKQALRHAQAEMDRHVGKERWVNLSDIKNLVYLQAILKETLRLYPPAPLMIAHEAVEDCYVRGYYVKKGTEVFVNVWKLHRDPSVWSEPERFLPERFLTKSGDVDEGNCHFGFMPFGYGRRACPGTSLGTQVSLLTLARLLQGFQLEVPTDKPIDMREGIAITLSKAEPLEISLTSRLPSQFYQC